MAGTRRIARSCRRNTSPHLAEKVGGKNLTILAIVAFRSAKVRHQSHFRRAKGNALAGPWLPFAQTLADLHRKLVKRAPPTSPGANPSGTAGPGRDVASVKPVLVAEIALLDCPPTAAVGSADRRRRPGMARTESTSGNPKNGRAAAGQAMILMDTDHPSVLKYPEGPRYPRLVARMEASGENVFATTIV
jgi:hypothetical protein